MYEFLLAYKRELIYTVLIILIISIIQFILKKAAHRVGEKSGINLNRTRLMFKYINILIILISVFLLAFAWGVGLTDLALIFSSTFAVIGVALFAIWSILSNVTSGIILFFSFPYKIGDTIQIHDKDFPFEGVIEDVKAFHLHLRNQDGQLVTYPNNLLLQKAVTLVKEDNLSNDDKDAL